MASVTLRRILAFFAAAIFTSALFAQEVDEYALQASRLVERQQLSEAARILRKGLDVYPNSPELLLQLGALMLFLGQVEQGGELIDRALFIDPHNPDILRQSGEARLRQGKVAEAVELFQKALWHGSSDAESHYRLGFIRFIQGDDSQALREMQKAVELNPLKADFRRFYSLLLSLQKKEEESFRQLLAAFRLDPNDPETLYRLSRKTRGRGNPGQALEFAEMAAEKDPENPVYLRELADLNRRLGLNEAADQLNAQAEALEKAFDAYSKALVLKAEGQLDQAIKILRESMENAPPFPTGMMLLADLHRRGGQDDDAFEIYARVLEIDPGRAEARSESAWIQAGQGSLESAIELLKNSAEARLDRSLLEGYQLMLKNDWEGALAKFQAALKEDPLTPGLLKLVGFCLNETGRSEEALSQLAKARRLQPYDEEIDQQVREVKFDKARGHQDRGEWSQALLIYRELQLAEPKQPDYFLNAAYCRQQQGDLVGAVDDYRRGLRLNPSGDWARINLASVLYRLSRFEESLVEWQRIVKRSKTSDAYFQLGLCLSRLDRHPEAEVAFETAMRLGGQSRELIYNLGVTRLRLMKLQNAWALIRRSAEMGYPPAQKLWGQAREQARQRRP